MQTSRPHPDGVALVQETQFFDGRGRIWQTTQTGPDAANPIQVIRSFDNRGNLASETVPRHLGGPLYSTTYRYDALGRLILQTNPDATTRRHVYDTLLRIFIGPMVPVGIVVTNDELNRPSWVVNDAYGRPIEVARYLNGAVVAETRAYDRLGRLTGVVDPGGSAWSYTYDLRGLRRTATDPDLGAWLYSYDLASRLTLQTDARGLATSLTYDGIGRVLTRNAPRVGGVIEATTNTYDQPRTGFFNVGHLTSASKTVGGVCLGLADLRPRRRRKAVLRPRRFRFGHLRSRWPDAADGLC